ncbi:MAG TPA: cupin domain-containing protein [Candidatus Eisenbacteria bacterium]|nr:cupin domain-containing protein [Candidatus Eisenbacteria bacterium]
MNFDSSYLELLLQKATYEQGLGANLVRIAQTKIGNENVVLLEVKVTKGTDIAPHFHEHSGEICIPLTFGKLRFGKVEKDENGAYKMDGDKAVTSWDIAEQTLEPGKSFEVPEGVAHHFVALEDSPMIVLFLLPESHAAATDRIYSTYPTGYTSKSKK